MPTPRLARLVLVMTGSCLAVVCCSSPSPVTPSPTRDASAISSASPGTPTPPDASAISSDAGQVESALRAGAVAGTYDVSFLNGGSPVSELPVCDGELTLHGHVQAQVSGAPAQVGTILFEYCSYGGPKNDITRPDEAPMAACEAGTARWSRLGALAVNQSGDAYLDFGVVQIPRTVGFRIRYIQQHGTIASGTADPKDFTWVAASCP